jgi:metacaspase-1
MTKYALLIGINYTGTFAALRGCINDVVEIRKLIKPWGFLDSNITFMTDNTKGSMYPNAYNITYQLNKLCSTLKAGDQAIFYFSGHGTRIKDTSGDESNSLDSCIVPIDFRSVGVIIDDVIRYYLNKIPSDANLFCVFDSCNSGSICDLKYQNFDVSYRKDITLKLKGFDYTEWARRQMVTVNEKQTDTLGNVISLSGCKDDQFSMDLGRNGALTTAFLQVIKKFSIGGKPTLQLQHILQNVRGVIQTMRLSQAPQMMTGKPYDTNVLFRDFLKI